MCPKISEFEGLHIYMYNEIGGRHHLPHVHVSCNGYDAVYNINGMRLIEGSLPKSKEKILLEWLILKELELLELWKQLNRNNVTITIFKIDPIKRHG